MSATDTTVLMYVPGIEGSATLVGNDPGLDGSHEGWVPITSCSFKFAREATATDTDEETEETPAPVTSVEPISVKRIADNSSAKILMWLANQDQKESMKEQVIIDYCTPSGKYFLRYELSGVELVSSSISYSAPDEVSETLTLTYAHIAIYQRPIDISGVVAVDREGTAEYTVYEPE